MRTERHGGRMRRIGAGGFLGALAITAATAAEIDPRGNARGVDPGSGPGRGLTTPATRSPVTGALPLIPRVSLPAALSLTEFLRHFDLAQEETRTLVAGFTEEKRLRLLAVPRVTRGEFIFQRPNMVRWEYAGAAPRVFILTESRYLAYEPASKRAEDVDIRTFVGKRLFRFLGFGQSSRELAKYYDLEVAADSGVPETRLLVLTPRKRRVRDRIVAMRIWVDAETFLPRQVAYEDTEGDSTVLRFDQVRVNLDIDPRRFDLVLPADVAVSRSFDGFAFGQRSF